jgi:large subunit ribosomal protein L16
MKLPKKLKYKKYQKGSLPNYIRCNRPLFSTGHVCLQATSFGRVHFSQLVALCGFLRKRMKKKGKILCRILSYFPVTRKPLEVRMGKGKGNVAFWATDVQSGSVICEIITTRLNFAQKTLRDVQSKFHLKTKIFFRRR